MKKYYLPLIAISMIVTGLSGLAFFANGSCH